MKKLLLAAAFAALSMAPRVLAGNVWHTDDGRLGTMTLNSIACLPAAI